MSAVSISVVVATCNRSQKLRDLLEALLRSDCSNHTWDAWIVDNNSKDDTRAVVASFVSREPRIHYVFESVQGKAYALNRVISQVRGDIVAFTDDDCIPDSHWINNMATAFAADSELGFVGGRVELFNADDNPTTTRTWPDRRFVSTASDALTLIIGCNMAIRRELLRTIGDFDPKITPGSGKDAGFEDLDLIYRAFKKNMRVEYRPDIVLYHNHGRRSRSDVAELERKYVRGRGSFYAKYIVRGDRAVLKLAYWEIRSTLKELAKKLLEGKSGKEELKLLSFLFAGAMTRFSK